MSKTFSKKVLSSVIAASFLAEAGALLAQDMLEEVIVTARKREESILKVPVTVSTLSGKTIDQYGISNVKDIANITPGLNFNQGPLSSGVLVSMRGVGTGTNNPTIDQSIALVVDGMQFTQGLAFQAATFDMAQVEVLKGPQALFFGKAAPAGVIAIRTADPGEERELSLRAGYESEAEEGLGELILSGPVTDTLGLRLAAQFTDKEGYFKNKSVPADHPTFGSLGAKPVKYDNMADTETTLLRGTAVWRPTDSLSARLKLNYSDQDIQGNGGELQYHYCPEGTGSFIGNLAADATQPPPVQFIGDTDCKINDKIWAANMNADDFVELYNNGVPFMEAEQYFGTLDLSYDFGNDLSLTSVTGYYDVTQKSMVNGSATTIVGTPFAIQGKLDRWDFTQELRLTSDYSGPLNFMLGAFYQDSETDYFNQLPYNLTYNELNASLGVPAFPPALAKADNHITIDTISFFGQVLWQIIPDLELGVGVRWTDEERKHEAKDLLPNLITGGAVPPQPVDLAQPKISSDNWSPEVSLTWTPTDEFTLYGNVKRAYKSGSFDTGGAIADGDDVSFDDERVTGGELGIKSRLMSGMLAINTAGYYYKFKDLQVEANEFNPAEGVASVRTNNAASADVYGIDFELSYLPEMVDGLTLSAAVNWNKSEYDEYDTALCWTGQLLSDGCDIDLDGNGIGDAQDLSGEPLLRAPEWTANLGFNYERPVFDGMNLQVGSYFTYSDEYSAGAENWSHMYQDSYTTTNASVALSGRDDQWVVEVIGNNLTDEVVFGKCTVGGFADSLLYGSRQSLTGTGTATGGPGGKGEVGCHAERGRALWLRLTWNFF